MRASHLGRLVDGLLQYGRQARRPLQRTEIQPAELIRQQWQVLSSRMGDRRVELQMGGLPACQTDPAMLRLTWAHLLENALKFTIGRDPALVEIGSKCEGPEVEYYIHDNGVGFDMKYAGRLFGIFQRLQRPEQYDGAGVGLALVRSVVPRHGGRVWADAGVNTGATIYFTLGSAL